MDYIDIKVRNSPESSCDEKDNNHSLQPDQSFA